MGTNNHEAETPHSKYSQRFIDCEGVSKFLQKIQYEHLPRNKQPKEMQL